MPPDDSDRHDAYVQTAGKAAFEVAKAVVPGAKPVAAFLQTLIGSMETGDSGFAKAIEEEIREAVFTRLPEVEQRVAALERDGIPVKFVDVARVWSHYAKTWASAADAKKRKLLEDAFVRSFDREMYESGLLNTLWGALERLDYGELYLLRELTHPDTAERKKAKQRAGFDKGLSLGCYHAKRLKQEGLLEFDRLPGAVPTELGHRLRVLAWDQLPSGEAQ